MASFRGFTWGGNLTLVSSWHFLHGSAINNRTSQWSFSYCVSFSLWLGKCHPKLASLSVLFHSLLKHFLFVFWAISHRFSCLNTSFITLWYTVDLFIPSCRIWNISAFYLWAHTASPWDFLGHSFLLISGDIVGKQPEKEGTKARIPRICLLIQFPSRLHLNLLKES